MSQKKIVVVNEGMIVLDICTKLKGSPDSAAGSTLFKNLSFYSDDRCVTHSEVSGWVAWIMLCVGSFYHSLDSRCFYRRIILASQS